MLLIRYFTGTGNSLDVEAVASGTGGYYILRKKTLIYVPEGNIISKIYSAGADDPPHVFRWMETNAAKVEELDYTLSAFTSIH